MTIKNSKTKSQRSAKADPETPKSLVKRMYTTAGVDPLSTVEYERRDSAITNPDGSVVSATRGAEIPRSWSQLATDIVVSKYFRRAGLNGDATKGETSVRHVVYRIAHTIREVGEANGYFIDADAAETFESELAFLLVNQYGAFNSPVWFNLGLFHRYGITGSGGNWAWDDATGAVKETPNAYQRPQCSACFIQPIEDDLMSIYELVQNEARLFKWGSGTGTNFSAIRGRQEKLSGGGTSSGLISFLEVFDRAAGATKSGGTTRRAAKLVCLDMDHPEIVDFIEWKMREEKKAQALIAAGYPSDFNGEAYHTVSGQNSNNSVRVTDAFMAAVENDGEWQTRMRTTGKVCETFKARDLWRKIAESAWHCADPGVQYDTTINDWHTCPNTGRINASNPCCFTGDTLVDTSDGKVPIADLESIARNGGVLPHVYAFDTSTRLPVLRRVLNAWVAGETTQLVEVRTARGMVLRCTPEHGFLLRCGDYVEASRLKAGDRLRKVGRATNAARGGRHYLNHRATEEVPNGTVWQNRFVWEQMEGEIPSGYHVHHRNEDPTDDRRQNLELREGFEHLSEHNTGDQNNRFLDVDSRLLVEAWDDITDEGRRDAERGKAIFKRMIDLRTSGMSFAQIASALASDGVRPDRADAWSASTVHVALRQGYVGRRSAGEVTVSRWNAYIARNGLEGVLPKANVGGVRGVTWEEFGAWVERERDNVNDSVVSVTTIELDTPVRVYDIEVDGVHNFGVASPGAIHSVIVHNSEYMHLDDTACNLSSLNLTKFLRDLPNGECGFDVEAYRHAARVFFIAQEILVDLSSYPTKNIAKNSHDYRPLGLGYANLGTLLMIMGLPYDSDAGRSVASSLTAILTGHAYRVSAEMAALKGPFAGYAKNREPMLRVMRKHRDAAYKIDANGPLPGILLAAREDWDEAVRLGEKYGYRNAQSSVIAPTGTIGLLMDCDTTGIEPDFSIVKYKKLAGGGYFKIVNASVERALKRLGYSAEQSAEIIAYVAGTNSFASAPVVNREYLKSKGFADDDVRRVEAALPGSFTIDGAFAPHVLGADLVKRLDIEEESKVAGFSLLAKWGISSSEIETLGDHALGRSTIEGAPHLRAEHYAVFDCANRCGKHGTRFIEPIAHLKMMAAAQPFIAGAISKTVNVPNEATVEEIAAIYHEGWKLGLKAVALYRDGCKASQPLSSSGDKKKSNADEKPVETIEHPVATPTAIASPAPRAAAVRHRLPKKRHGFTQEARVGGHKVFLRTGEYDDGQLGEIFIDMHKEGASFRSLMNCLAISVSMGLQCGIKLEDYVEQFTFTRFEPQGPVDGHANVKFATSIVDYVFRVLAVEYLNRHDLAHVQPDDAGAAAPDVFAHRDDAPYTSSVGSINQHLSKMMGDAPICDSCGHVTVRNGTCYRCLNCGSSMGCS